MIAQHSGVLTASIALQGVSESNSDAPPSLPALLLPVCTATAIVTAPPQWTPESAAENAAEPAGPSEQPAADPTISAVPSPVPASPPLLPPDVPAALPLDSTNASVSVISNASEPKQVTEV
ncbi:uncharacterized protein LOC131555438 [Ammospiza caudacuta]|uniref:uncharacterized protein LOC131555438 n=1 Tax=Ammospiza caudacuta TaxID=2857398 RepID=UPI0027396D32|nr:uncharacterized protein LOC131555438 [Ammospiza caudacuta]